MQVKVFRLMMIRDGTIRLPDTPPKEHSSISIPDVVVLCNGCNQNIYPEEGCLVYLGLVEVKKDLPYDFYSKAREIE